VPLFLSPATNAALFAAMLRQTPEAMRGRVNNALIQVATGLAALAPLVAGLLVEDVSSHWAIGAFAVALAVSAVMALTLKGLRQAEAAV
jgi:MFS family permease